MAQSVLDLYAYVTLLWEENQIGKTIDAPASQSGAYVLIIVQNQLVDLGITCHLAN